MKSIQSKILLVVIAGLLVITALVSAIAVNMTHEVMHRDADRILKNAAQSQAASINDILGDVVKSISIMEHYATEEIENANILKDTDARDKYIQTVDTMFTEVALNTSGVEGFYMRLDPEVSSGTSGFYKMLDSDGSLKYMPLTDLTKYKKDDKQNVGWYYEAVNAGKGVWLDPYYFPGDDSLLISFVQPLYVQRELIGVVGFDMDFSYLVKYIDEIRVYESGFAVLLAKDGVTVYNNIPDNDSTHNPHTESKVQLKNGMYLELRADYKDIQRDIYPMLTKIVLAFIVVLIASIVYTVIVTDRIVRPLKQLTASAEAISA
ncbi:MAG: hypothetical protein J6V50_03565, partial [Clostridia bacterium]|nr:hypothetical protein [Clostridia bacterium]